MSKKALLRSPLRVNLDNEVAEVHGLGLCVCLVVLAEHGAHAGAGGQVQVVVRRVRLDDIV